MPVLPKAYCKGKIVNLYISHLFQREAAKSVEKRQTKIQIKKALSQDPSIFQYDEVYEDIKEKGNTGSKKEEKKQVSSIYPYLFYNHIIISLLALKFVLAKIKINKHLNKPETKFQ